MDTNNIKTESRRILRQPQLSAFEINGKVPPQALELEKSVLGALMLDKDKLFSVLDKLHEGLFYKTEHQTIYNAIRHLVNGNKDVDILTVTQQLLKEGKMEDAGGSYYLSTLTNNVVSAAHIEYHIHILAEKYMKRELIRTSTDCIRDAYDETTDAIDLVDKAEKNLMEVSELSFKGESMTMDSLVGDFEKRLNSKDENDDYGVMSGFVELDRLTSGFQPGSLVILAARPAMGKTACGLSMARNVAVQFGKPVAYFSLEMTGDELLMRLLAAEAEIPVGRLKRISSLRESEKDTLVNTMMSLKNAPIFIDDSQGLDIFELRAKCRRLKMRHDIQMVIIDYLQLMTSSSEALRNRNREQEVSAISRQLKEMAKELKLPVIAMAQLARRVDDRPMGIPTLADLRESGSIEQDADIVIAIHRPIVYGMTEDENGNSTENLANLRVLKHRSGELGVASLCFEGKYVRFSDFRNEQILESRMNSDIRPNNDFDSSASRR